MTCLTDSPDVHVVSLPHLPPQLKVDAVHLVGRSDTDMSLIVARFTFTCCNFSLGLIHRVFYNSEYTISLVSGLIGFFCSVKF